jgi:hypothetical protein
MRGQQNSKKKTTCDLTVKLSFYVLRAYKTEIPFLVYYYGTIHNASCPVNYLGTFLLLSEKITNPAT